MDSSEGSAGMQWDRIKSLLLSSDWQCRHYALEKVTKVITASSLPRPELQQFGLDVDRSENVFLFYFAVFKKLFSENYCRIHGFFFFPSQFLTDIYFFKQI